jgi:type IV fimbrial biogenesis protein FimT
MRVSQGLSLLEMLTVLAVLATLGFLAVPSLAHLSGNASRAAAVNQFFHALFLARSESIKRRQVVSVCKSADGRTCLHRGVDWTIGWIVFVNTDRDDPPVRDPDERVIAVYEGWRSGRITSSRLAYSFRPYTQGVVNGTITFCDARGPDEARAIIVSHTGRPRIARRDSNGRPLRC